MMWQYVMKFFMDKTKTRIILVLISVIVLGGSYFGVLATEQKKRLATRESMIADINESLSESERIRQEYFADVEAKRAEWKKSMDDAKAKYDDLMKKQPALINANKKAVSVPVQKTVVESKPASTRTTKSS